VQFQSPAERPVKLALATATQQTAAQLELQDQQESLEKMVHQAQPDSLAAMANLASLPK